MSCGWEGNRRSGVALAIRRRLLWFIHLYRLADKEGRWAPRLHPFRSGVALATRQTPVVQYSPELRQVTMIPAAGKVTVGLASHRPRVTSFIGLSTGLKSRCREAMAGKVTVGLLF